MADKWYEVAMEVEGPMAMFASHDSGSEQTTTLVPTYSAVKGIFESVLFMRHVEVRPTKVHICRPIELMETGFNCVHSPRRKPEAISEGNPVQYRMVMLSGVVYQLFARVRETVEETRQFATAASSVWLERKVNHAHSYQMQFLRHLRQGRVRRGICLGKSICAATYVGPLRQETKPCQAVNLMIPILQKTPFSRPTFGEKVDFKKISVLKNVKVKNGVLEYD